MLFLVVSRCSFRLEVITSDSSWSLTVIKNTVRIERADRTISGGLVLRGFMFLMPTWTEVLTGGGTFQRNSSAEGFPQTTAGEQFPRNPAVPRGKLPHAIQFPRTPAGHAHTTVGAAQMYRKKHTSFEYFSNS